MADSRPTMPPNDDMAFERSIYRESIHLIRRRFPVILFAVVTQYSVQMADYGYDIVADSSSLLVLTYLGSLIVIWAYVTYSIFEYMLLGNERHSQQDSKRFLGYALLFTLVAILPGILLIVMYAVLSDLAGSLNSGAEISTTVPATITGLAWLFAVGLWGTILPAFVSRRGWSLAEAAATGRNQFLWIIGRLIAGPGFVIGVGIAASYVAAWSIQDMGLWHFQILALIDLATFVWGLVLTSVIFARAYMRGNDISPKLFA